MPNYQKLYLELFKASEQAIDLLISAQQKCEKLFVASSEPDVKMVELLSN